MITGLLGLYAGALDQVVAGEQNLVDGIAKGLVLAAHRGGRGDAARGNRPGPWHAGKEGRTPGFVARRLRQVNAFKEASDRGRQLGSQIVLGQKVAHFGDGGVVGRGGAGGERVQRPQGNVGHQQADLGGFRRGYGQTPALYRGKVLA